MKTILIILLMLCGRADAQYNWTWIKTSPIDSTRLEFMQAQVLDDSIFIPIFGRYGYKVPKTVFQPSTWSTSHTHSYASLTGIPSTFTASVHSHPISEITNLQGSLDGKSATGHTHTIAEITNYAGYVMNISAANVATTTDAQTIYIGLAGNAPSTSDGSQRVYVPKSGTIKAVYVYANSGTAGTNEAWVLSIRKNSTTDTQIQSLASNSANRVWSNTGLSIAVVAGDYIEIKSVNPTWSNNPANVRFNASIYIE